MVNLDSLLLLIRMQQLEQLQRLNGANDFSATDDSTTDSTTSSFASILSSLMDILGSSGGLGSESSLGSESILGLGLGSDQAGSASAQPAITGLSQPERANSSPSSLDQIFNDFATKYNLSPSLLKTVAEAESSLDPNAVSPAGAQGVMQLMPSTAKGLGVTDPFNPVQNIEGGAKYLKSLLDRFDNNLPNALAAYNAGPNAVKRYGGVPPYKETQNYVRKIMANLVDYTG